MRLKKLLDLSVWISTTLLLVVLSTRNTLASPIDIQRAQAIASRYIQIDKGELRSLTQKGVQPYYIFNDQSGKGFVIVSGEDQAGEVLGQSSVGSLRSNQIPTDLKWLLDKFSKRIKAGQFSPKKESLRATPNYRYVEPYPQEITPLLKTKWGQDFPYNEQTPVINNAHTPTGCVATAMGQLMYYYRWPVTGRGSLSYTTTTNKIQLSRNFSESSYDWARMPLSNEGMNYYGVNMASLTTDQRQQATAVAKFLVDVGVSVEMDYTSNYSGAYTSNALKALNTYFGYKAIVVNRVDYGGNSTLEALIRKELVAQNPILMTGSSFATKEGHAWIVDGYKNGAFSVNWGWDGLANGYYALSFLTPSASGNEFEGRKLTFDYDVDIIIAYPQKDPNNPTKPDVENPEEVLRLSVLESSKFQFKNGTNDITRTPVLPIEFGGFGFFPGKDGLHFSGDLGIGLYDPKGRLIHIYPSEYNKNGGVSEVVTGGLRSRSYLDMMFSFKLAIANLPVGYYTIKPMSNARKDGEWQGWLEMRKAIPSKLYIGTDDVRLIGGNQNTERSFRFVLKPELVAPVSTGGSTKLSVVIQNESQWNHVNGSIQLQLLPEGSNQPLATIDTRRPEAQKVLSLFKHSKEQTTLTFSIPANIPAGRYRVRALLKAFEQAEKYRTENNLRHTDITEQLQTTTIKDYNDEPFYIDVLPALEVHPMLQSVYFYSSKNEQDPLKSNELNLEGATADERFFLKMQVRNMGSQNFRGPVYVRLRNVETDELFYFTPVKRYTIASGETIDLSTEWKTVDELSSLRDQGIYRVEVEGEIDGKRLDLWNNDQERLFIRVRGGQPVKTEDAPRIIQQNEVETIAAEPAPAPVPAPEPQPEPTPEPEPQPAPAPVPAPEPQPEPTPQPEPQPAPAPVPAPEPQPEPTPQPNPNVPTPIPTPVEEVESTPLEWKYFAGDARLVLTGKPVKKVEVFDLTGRQQIVPVTSTEERTEVLLHSLPKSIYLVRVRTIEKVVTIRLSR